MYGRLKRNAAAYSSFLTLSNRLPARVVYREPYFAVRSLLEREESGGDIMPELSSRLATVIRTTGTWILGFDRMRSNPVTRTSCCCASPTWRRARSCRHRHPSCLMSTTSGT
jgi:hypothetical protein